MEQRNVNRRAVGASYEKLAGDYLRQRGYEILACNFRCRQGEIDIVAKEKGTLVFVEVKYRSSMEARLRQWMQKNSGSSAKQPHITVIGTVTGRIIPAGLMWWRYAEMKLYL